MIRKKITSKELRKKTKKKLEKLFGGRRSRIFVTMICNKCKREYKIRVNTKEQKERFKELRETWICLICDTDFFKRTNR